VFVFKLEICLHPDVGNPSSIFVSGVRCPLGQPWAAAYGGGRMKAARWELWMIFCPGVSYFSRSLSHWIRAAFMACCCRSRWSSIPALTSPRPSARKRIQSTMPPYFVHPRLKPIGRMQVVEAMRMNTMRSPGAEARNPQRISRIRGGRRKMGLGFTGFQSMWIAR
jgi:hypothetical protein